MLHGVRRLFSASCRFLLDAAPLCCTLPIVDHDTSTKGDHDGIQRTEALRCKAALAELGD